MEVLVQSRKHTREIRGPMPLILHCESYSVEFIGLYRILQRRQPLTVVSANYLVLFSLLDGSNCSNCLIF